MSPPSLQLSGVRGDEVSPVAGATVLFPCPTLCVLSQQESLCLSLCVLMCVSGPKSHMAFP